MEMVLGHNDVQFQVPTVVSISDLFCSLILLFSLYTICGPVFSNYIISRVLVKCHCSDILFVSCEIVLVFVGVHFCMGGKRGGGLSTQPYVGTMTNRKWVNRELIDSLTRIAIPRLNKAIVNWH